MTTPSMRVPSTMAEFSDVGQDVAAHDRLLRTPGHDGQAHEVALPEREDLAADDARIPRPVDGGQDDHDVPHAGAHHGREEDREGQRRQRQPRVRDAHDHLVDPAAEIAGQDAEPGADDAGDDDRGEAHDHGHARAEDEARQHVAPDVVGAEEVRLAAAGLPCGRTEAVAELLRLRSYNKR